MNQNKQGKKMAFFLFMRLFVEKRRLCSILRFKVTKKVISQNANLISKSFFVKSRKKKKMIKKLGLLLKVTFEISQKMTKNQIKLNHLFFIILTTKQVFNIYSF